MAILEISLHSFRAKHAVIYRKLFPRLEPDDFVVLHLELNPALHAAETAMRFHELVRSLLLPAAIGLVDRMRPELFDEGCFVECWYRHMLMKAGPNWNAALS